MNLFCLLWMPSFYFLWRTLKAQNNPAGGVWALIAGSLAAIARFFLGSFVDPEGFGFSRWLSGCVDLVALPALMPFLIYLFLTGFKIISGTIDFTNFALLWLIPVSAAKAFIWVSLGDPVLLVLLPVLWSAIALGVPFYVKLMLNSRIFTAIPSFIGILSVPLAAVSSYWAFYCQKPAEGFLLLTVALAPLLLTLILSFIRRNS